MRCQSPSLHRCLEWRCACACVGVRACVRAGGRQAVRAHVGAQAQQRAVRPAAGEQECMQFGPPSTALSQRPVRKGPAQLLIARPRRGSHLRSAAPLLAPALTPSARLSARLQLRVAQRHTLVSASLAPVIHTLLCAAPSRPRAAAAPGARPAVRAPGRGARAAAGGQCRPRGARRRLHRCAPPPALPAHLSRAPPLPASAISSAPPACPPRPPLLLPSTPLPASPSSATSNAAARRGPAKR